MVAFDAYQNLSGWDQMLHNLHVLLCGLAVVIGIIPLATVKGSVEHRFGGLIYVPVSFVALGLATLIAWRESSLVLFCFNGFCTYLLLSGWRATHEKAKPVGIDWAIPAGLLLLAVIVSLDAVFGATGDQRAAYLIFFALNAFYLAGRDLKRLRRRAFMKRSPFLAQLLLPQSDAEGWLGRHIAGMVGSMLANLSVLVLTLLPLSLHALWPATLITMSLGIAAYDYHKKRAVRRTVAQFLQPTFRPRRKGDEDFRRAA